MALNEYQLFDFELVESLGSGLEASYTKLPELLACNPKGLVPTLVLSTIINKKEVLCDSIDILLRLEHDVATKKQATEATTGSLPAGREDIQKQYDAANEWNRRICSTFYRVLMKQNQDDRDIAWNEMVQSLSDFSQHLSPSDDEKEDNKGGFYDQHDNPDMVDFTVYPFVSRLFVIQHYRGYQLKPTDNKDHAFARRLFAWQARMEARPAVAQTREAPDYPTKLLPIYEKYADGTANSQVGNAIRHGKEAHTV